jgi:hypothetical protein
MELSSLSLLSLLVLSSSMDDGPDDNSRRRKNRNMDRRGIDLLAAGRVTAAMWAQCG